MGGNRLVLLGLLLVIVFNIAVRWRLADMPLERDEGEYAYMGQLLRQGIPPYRDAYNMKFPGTYLAYAALMTLFGETTRGIHLGLTLVTSLTAILVFLIGKKLFSSAGGLVAAASCVVLSASSGFFGLAGHATHFVTLFITAGVLALLWVDENPKWWRWFMAGAMFSMAVLMKQHAVIVAGIGLLWVGFWHWRKKQPGVAVVKSVAAYATGAMTPLLIVGLWLGAAGVWKQFYFWTMQYATQYASAVSIKAAWPAFVDGFMPGFNSTWALWLLGGVGLLSCLMPRQPLERRLIPILFAAGMFAACPGFHFRGHYFLPALPGLALLIGASFSFAATRVAETPARVLVVGVFSAALMLAGWSNREIWFKSAPEEAARRLYSLNPFTESRKVADFVRERTSPDERIAVVGSEPQIYFYANRKAASGYIYMYALTEPLPLAQKMRDEFAKEIETANPRYIVFVDIITSWVSLSQADSSILEWWNRFSKNYDAVAAVTVAADQPTSYCWNESEVRNLTLSDCHLIVYRRK
jgi:4-amino-4-deoxy-L-arabinose transferase-like glycosyltransferase